MQWCHQMYDHTACWQAICAWQYTLMVLIVLIDLLFLNTEDVGIEGSYDFQQYGISVGLLEKGKLPVLITDRAFHSWGHFTSSVA